MRFEKFRVFMEKKLSEELSPNYSYHSPEHTQDVLQAAMMYAELEHIDERDKELLKVAVLLHDSGFILTAKEHEKQSCELAKEYLPHYDYTSFEINSICGMIMATKIPQTPQNKLEEIICDADLDYLGRSDFWEIGELLFKELQYLQILQSEEDWNRLQIDFLAKHRYFTEHAIDLRNKTKLTHLQLVIQKLNE
jgi:uncharacterized protein